MLAGFKQFISRGNVIDLALQRQDDRPPSPSEALLGEIRDLLTPRA